MNEGHDFLVAETVAQNMEFKQSRKYDTDVADQVGRILKKTNISLT